jgi:hypothetical protein
MPSRFCFAEEAMMPVENMERKQAKLERLLVTRMNALAKMWSTRMTRPVENNLRVYSSKKGVMVSYDIVEDNGTLAYELKVVDDLSGRTVHHATIPFQEDGNGELIPNSHGNGVVFANSKFQANLFAESMTEFVRVLRMADRNRNEIVEQASKLLPRQA